MENLTSDELKKVMKKIEKLIRCPVCYNNLQPPVAVCENGHGTCSVCRAKLLNCPLCKQSFKNIRMRQFEEILEVIPHVCKFQGCQEYVKMDDDHERWCGYRTTYCNKTDCYWKGQVKDLASHITWDFLPNKIMKEENFSWFYDDVNEMKKPYRRCNPVLAFGKVFWFHAINNPSEKLFKFSLFCVPKEKIVSSLQIAVTLMNGKQEYSTITILHPENLTREEHFCISLPSSLVQSFINSEGNLSFSLVIKKKRTT